MPESLAGRISNVEIIIEEEPPLPEEPESGDLNLLGLYEGVPLTERDSGYWGFLPDRIILYKKNLEQAARTSDELKVLLAETVIHEVAHHFGIDDDRLEQLGWD